jgi:hypothetical protein
MLPFTDTLSGGGAAKLSRMVSPVVQSKSVSDPVKQEMARLAYGFSQPAQTINDYNLTLHKMPNGQDAYDRLLELTGTIQINGATLSQALNRLVASREYKAMTDPEGRGDGDNGKVKAISRVLGMYRRQARTALYKEDPELRAAILGKTGSGLPPNPQVNPILQALQ